MLLYSPFTVTVIVAPSVPSKKRINGQLAGSYFAAPLSQL